MFETIFFLFSNFLTCLRRGLRSIFPLCWMNREIWEISYLAKLQLQILMVLCLRLSLKTLCSPLRKHVRNLLEWIMFIANTITLRQGSQKMVPFNWPFRAWHNKQVVAWGHFFVSIGKTNPALFGLVTAYYGIIGVLIKF